MTLRSLVAATFAAAALGIAVIGSEGCTVTTDAGPAVKCTPGNYVFCRCADRGEGTKLCRDDGASFEPCTTGAEGECVGGEVSDPDTGKPVEGPPQVEPITAGPPGSPVDGCPGKPTSLGTTTIIIEGDTTGAKDKAKGKPGACAAGGGGPDHVYHLQPTGTGSLSVKVQGSSTLNPTVYVRTACDDEGAQVDCAETTGLGGSEQLSMNVVTGRDYYLIVDGASGSAGKYTLTLKLTTGPVCGDGKIDTNEACDDGNNKPDADGCSASCLQVNGDPAAGAGCPGHAVHLWKGRTVTGTGSTLPYGNTFTEASSNCTVGSTTSNLAKDHVYEVTAHAAGNVRVTLTPDAGFNAMLVARRTCADALSQGPGMCSNDTTAGLAETIEFPVSSGEVVYVAADGVSSGQGSYTIKFELP